MSAPKVFVSHATEDKDRFVLKFAERLRASGIDAWLDRWEMLPGDSVVDKIFDEGIKEASAFIVVLSSVSVEKKWVREELNAAVVARLSRQSKVIPIVIDDCEIPEALKTTLWQRIPDLTNYDEELKRIISAIHDVREKPPLGESPAYVSAKSADFAPTLKRTDAAVLHCLCDAAFSEGHNVVGDLEVLGSVEAKGLSSADIIDGVDVLEHHGLLTTGRVLGGGYKGGSLSHVRLTLKGLDLYLRYRFPNFDEMTTNVAALIVNENKSASKQLIDATKYPEIVIEHIVNLLEQNSYLKVSKYLNGNFIIHHVSPLLKRQLG